ncbi:MAG: hypothetical protein H6837_14950 [Planctomycetes bacterium]|nr:hypothetical protein [Planctomycetota bacterium]
MRVYSNGSEVVRFDSAGSEIRTLGFDAGGTTLITGDDLGQIRMWPALAPTEVESRWRRLLTGGGLRPESSAPPVLRWRGADLACRSRKPVR